MILEIGKSKNLWYRFCIWLAIDEEKSFNYIKNKFASSAAQHSVSINGKEFHYPFSVGSLCRSVESDDDDDVEMKRRLYEVLDGKRYVDLEELMPKFKRIAKDVILDMVKKR